MKQRQKINKQFLEPALHVLKRQALRDVVYEQGSHSAAVVGARDGTVALLPSCVWGEGARAGR